MGTKQLSRVAWLARVDSLPLVIPMPRSHLICLLTALLLAVSEQIPSQLSYAYPSYGNELAQFNRYITLADQFSHVNASYLYETYRTCGETVGFRNYHCRDNIRKQQTDTRQRLYTPKRDSGKKYIPDCSYRVLESNSTYSYSSSHSSSYSSTYSFLIAQEKCSSSFVL